MSRTVATVSLKTSRSRVLRPLVLGVLGVLALGFAACGADERPRSSVRLEAAADGSLRFERDALEARAGRAAIEMANPSDIPHAIGARGNGIDDVGETVGRDGTSSVEVELEPGVYELFCPVGGHEQAGMTAKLTVR